MSRIVLREEFIAVDGLSIVSVIAQVFHKFRLVGTRLKSIKLIALAVLFYILYLCSHI